MREIKFKAKTCNSEWVEGLLAHKDNKWYISNKVGMPFAFEVRPETISQYIGLNDKNGKEIYEGDIVKCNYNYYGDKGTYIGKVIFREDTCMFLITDTKSTNYEWWNEDKVVVGNIFDNPELLERGAE